MDSASQITAMFPSFYTDPQYSLPSVIGRLTNTSIDVRHMRLCLDSMQQCLIWMLVVNVLLLTVLFVQLCASNAHSRELLSACVAGKQLDSKDNQCAIKHNKLKSTSNMALTDSVLSVDKKQPTDVVTNHVGIHRNSSLRRTTSAAQANASVGNVMKRLSKSPRESHAANRELMTELPEHNSDKYDPMPYSTSEAVLVDAETNQSAEIMSPKTNYEFSMTLGQYLTMIMNSSDTVVQLELGVWRVQTMVMMMVSSQVVLLVVVVLIIGIMWQSAYNVSLVTVHLIRHWEAQQQYMSLQTSMAKAPRLFETQTSRIDRFNPRQSRMMRRTYISDTNTHFTESDSNLKFLHPLTAGPKRKRSTSIGDPSSSVREVQSLKLSMSDLEEKEEDCGIFVTPLQSARSGSITKTSPVQRRPPSLLVTHSCE